MKLFAASCDTDRLLKDLSDIREVVKNSEIDEEFVRMLFAKYGLGAYYEPTIGNDR